MASPTPADLAIEVVYAEPQRAIARTYRLIPPATIEDVLRQAAADAAFAGVDVLNATVGVFGRAVSRAEPLCDGDRVEIYRPLAADPKIARRNRARDFRKKSR
jgi:putative ubiquitin-RnfH superfamily antitoxin RatB of RatAB toxin-antitoxin module